MPFELDAPCDQPVDRGLYVGDLPANDGEAARSKRIYFLDAQARAVRIADERERIVVMIASPSVSPWNRRARSPSVVARNAISLW